MAGFDFIDEIEWSGANKLATLISMGTLTIGLLVSDLHWLKVMLLALGPLVALLFPHLAVWDVPRRYFMQEAPRGYVLIFGWCGVIAVFLYISAHSF